MAKVTESLRYFIVNRLNTNPAWKNIKVILSDSNVPGEGEHKIMNYVRAQRSHPDYNPNTSHVLYGLDADLILLGLGTHEPHFSILREIVTQAGGSNCYICGKPGHVAAECRGEPAESEAFNPATIAHKSYQFLRIDILREYLEYEMKPSTPVPFDYNLERVVDDFVFMCCFVGNDFLPHLPTLEIREGAVQLLMGLYKKHLPSFGDYLTLNGEVNLKSVQILLSLLGGEEEKILKKKKSPTRPEKFSQTRVREPIAIALWSIAIALWSSQ